MTKRGCRLKAVGCRSATSFARARALPAPFRFLATAYSLEPAASAFVLQPTAYSLQPSSLDLLHDRSRRLRLGPAHVSAASSVQGRRVGKTVAETRRGSSRRAYQEAYAQGREAGLASARAETQQLGRPVAAQVDAPRWDRSTSSRSRCRTWMRKCEEQLTKLALAVARQLVRRELQDRSSAGHRGHSRNGGDCCPLRHAMCACILHPEDAAVVRERLATPTADRAWTHCRRSGADARRLSRDHRHRADRRAARNAHRHA